jgi:aryl-alcohol dehydrogenase-like predicted oxidoreductase
MLFSALPDDARLWIFTAARPLSDEDQTRLRNDLNQFVRQWASHGRPVPGDVSVHADRFVIVGAHLEGGVSGCGIDSLTHAVEESGNVLGIDWVDGLQVVFRTPDGAIRVAPRPVFRRLVRESAVTSATPVFDTTVDRLGDLREHGLERPAGSTWHGRVFRLMEPA